MRRVISRSEKKTTDRAEAARQSDLAGGFLKGIFGNDQIDPVMGMSLGATLDARRRFMRAYLSFNEHAVRRSAERSGHSIHLTEPALSDEALAWAQRLTES